jgi:hypothetical protein
MATKLCQRLGFEHRRIPIVGPDRAGTIYSIVEKMPDYKHFDEACATYVSAFPDEGCINVRSNLSEIGRAVWRERERISIRFDPSDWIDIIAHKERGGEPFRQESIQYLREELEIFFGLLGYDCSNPYDPKLLGYDAWDLAYWEHRMSTWHAQVLLGSDFAFDTIIIFNSRRLLKHLLSAPRDARIKSTLYREFIARRCPEIKDFPINPQTGRGWALFRRSFRRARRRMLRRLGGSIRAIVRSR